MSKSKTKISMRAVKYALTCPTNRAMYQGCLLLGALVLGCVFFGQMLFAGTLGVLLLAGFGMTFTGSLIEYATAEQTGKQAMLSAWAKEATTAAERERRSALLESGDFDSAWQSSNLSYEGPRYNTNGTLMLPGHAGFDINGTAYGATGLSAAVYNPDTGSWVDPSTAYTSPLETSSSGGLDGLSDLGMGTGGIDMSPTKFD